MEEDWGLYDQTNMTKHRLARLWGLAFRSGRSLTARFLGSFDWQGLDRGAWVRRAFCGLLGRWTDELTCVVVLGPDMGLTGVKSTFGLSGG